MCRFLSSALSAPLLQFGIPAPGMVPHTLKLVFPLQLILSGNIITGTLRGTSEPSQVDKKINRCNHILGEHSVLPSAFFIFIGKMSKDIRCSKQIGKKKGGGFSFSTPLSVQAFGKVAFQHFPSENVLFVPTFEQRLVLCVSWANKASTVMCQLEACCSRGLVCFLFLLKVWHPHVSNTGLNPWWRRNQGELSQNIQLGPVWTGQSLSQLAGCSGKTASQASQV